MGSPSTTIHADDVKQTRKIGQVANIAEPLVIPDVKLTGVAAGTARSGEQLPVWQHLALMSDEPRFHQVAEGIIDFIQSASARAGHPVDTKRANQILLVIKADDTGQLWVDTAAVTLMAMSKRPLAAGQPVFESDIADILQVRFPAVDIQPSDRIIYLFRKDWRFGLYFDLRTERDLDIDDVGRWLGAMYRVMAYRHRYDALSDERTFSQLVGAGWFPFVELLQNEFRSLLAFCEAGLPLEEVEAQILASFDAQRIEHIRARWMAKPHVQRREKILQSGINSFLACDPVGCLKIVLTEIEGVLADSYREETGTSTHRLGKLLSFARAAGERRAGAVDTLMFPQEFSQYLETYTYAGFEPGVPTDRAGSRNVVGHGVASDEAYTMVRALQAILTLDQILFYL